MDYENSVLEEPEGFAKLKKKKTYLLAEQKSERGF